jgi:hypothetical protein
MTLPALSDFRTPSRSAQATGAALVALAIGAATFSFAVPADASTAKLNGLCTKKELGKKTTKLICSKSGTLFRWRSRSTGTSTSATGNNLGGTSEAVAGLPGASSGSGPATIGVAVLPFGTIPAGATSKVDINCTGLPSTPNTSTQSLSFPSAGGSNQVTFTVSPPSPSNPTGSTCTALATASVAAKLSLLVDGTPVAGPLATTVTGPGFTAVEGTKITVLVDYTSLAPAPVTTAAPAVAPALAPLATLPPVTVAPVSSTTGAPTTTASPLPLVLPTSGKTEVATRVLTQAPITFSGVSAELLCSPGAFGQGYQSQTLRFDRPSAILNPSVQLGAVSPGFGGTACQVDFALQGENLLGTSLRLILNGQIQTNTLTGTLIKSNSFDATKPFNLTLEISFPGLPVVATSPVGLPATATTTTIAGATTTTVAGAISGTVSGATTTTTTAAPAATATQATVTLTRAATGNAAPANLTGYTVTVSCTNAVVNGATLASADWVATYPATGGTAPVSLGLTATSVCTTTVVSVAAAGTGAITTGNLSLSVGGTPRGTGTNGSVTGGAIASPSAFTAVVTIGY